MTKKRDRITQYLLRGIYADRITSPLYQLFVIDGFVKHINNRFVVISSELPPFLEKNICHSISRTLKKYEEIL